MENSNDIDILVDSHSHMFADAFDEDRSAAIKRAIEAGVRKIILPNIDMDTIAAMQSLSIEFPDTCYSSIGLHPTDVKADFESVLSSMKEKYLSANIPEHLVAIGETGLDYYWDTTFAEEQKAALRQQIQWAKEYKLPIILHTRESTQDTIDIISDLKTDDLHGVFHCFSGTQEEAQQVLGLGFKIGVGGTITYKKNQMREWITELPLTAIVLETDSPYLSPVPYRGKRNESSYLTYVAAEVAALYQLELAEVATQTTASALELFSRVR